MGVWNLKYVCLEIMFIVSLKCVFNKLLFIWGFGYMLEIVFDYFVVSFWKGWYVLDFV